MGLSVAGLLVMSGLAESLWNDQPETGWGVPALFAATVVAAVLASSVKITTLEVAGMLLWAQMPLIGAQVVAWLTAPGAPDPNAKLCSCLFAHWFLHQQHGMFTLAESGALACLAVGAYAMATRARSFLQRALFVGLVVLSAGIGFALAGWAVGTLSGFAALVAGVFVMTARGVHRPRPVAAKGARLLVCLAMAVCCAAVASHLAFHPTQYVLFSRDFLSVAQSIVATYRALLVGLGGCAVLLVLGLKSGRSAWPSASSGVVLMAALGLLFGGALRLQHLRLESFDDLWTHRAKHDLRRLTRNRALLPEDAELLSRPVGWPLDAEVHGYAQPFPRIVRTHVHPDVSCEPLVGPRPQDERWVIVQEGQTFGEVASLVAPYDRAVLIPLSACLPAP